MALIAFDQLKISVQVVIYTRANSKYFLTLLCNYNNNFDLLDSLFAIVITQISQIL